MKNRHPIAVEVFANDRVYVNETIHFEGNDKAVLKLPCIIPKIKTVKELEIIVDAGITEKMTYGLSLPIYRAGPILSERIRQSGRMNLLHTSVDEPFVRLRQNSEIIFEPEAECMAYSAGVTEYSNFLKSLDSNAKFPDELQTSFSMHGMRLSRDLIKYERAWRNLLADERQTTKMTEAFLTYQTKFGLKTPIGFTRMIEANSPDSIAQAAALNVESTSICASNLWPKVLTLSICQTALRRISIIKNVISAVTEKNMFGDEFDFAYIELPNQDIHGDTVQRKNFMLLLGMADILREHGVVTMIGNVDLALSEACIGKGIRLTSTPLDGNTKTIRNQYEKTIPKHGKMPLPAEMDWIGFDSMCDEFEAQGRIYPYHSPTAVGLNGMDLPKFTPKAISRIRKLIFAEALEDLNKYNFDAAKKSEFAEGVVKRLWDSNKKNYSALFPRDNLSVFLG